jgi:hypothetical protein
MAVNKPVTIDPHLEEAGTKWRAARAAFLLREE